MVSDCAMAARFAVGYINVASLLLVFTSRQTDDASTPDRGDINMLYEGEWRTDKFVINNEDDKFERQTTDFRNWVDEDEWLPVEAERYHFYICHAYSWVHRAAMTHVLEGLEDAISLLLVEPVCIGDGWEFSEDLSNPLYGEEFLCDIYLRADDEFTGRVTVPVLWDRQREAIANNEPREITRTLDEAFDPLAECDVNFNPDSYEKEVGRLVDEIYEPINNSVYRTGFATTQKAYEEAVKGPFDALDRWDEVLDDQRLLAGDVVTEADIAMFTALIRFDHVYHTYLKCSKRAIHEYSNLWNYTRELYQLPRVARTVNMDHVVQHYFVSHGNINPKRIYGVGPDLGFDAEHDRDHLPADLPAALTAGD